jgi:hypothetical protein
MVSLLPFLQDSLSYFGDRRTENSNREFQGVETPSQVSFLFTKGDFFVGSGLSTYDLASS